MSVIRRHFSSGVTSLLSDAYKEHRLYSGSYDENMHSWDVRSMKHPLGTVAMGGGVWRIRQLPVTNDLSSFSGILATACMHGGFKLVDAETLEVVLHYSDHESLAYGIDVKVSNMDNQLTLASCSFYDHLLKIWNVSCENN